MTISVTPIKDLTEFLQPVNLLLVYYSPDLYIADQARYSIETGGVIKIRQRYIG